MIGLEVMLLNANISQHSRANSYDNHDPLRKRRLLLNRREILKLRQKQEEKGLTIVPLRMYFRCCALCRHLVTDPARQALCVFGRTRAATGSGSERRGGDPKRRVAEQEK